MDTIGKILENAFNASSGLIPGGFKTALKSIFPNNDVLIWSDVDHRNAATKYTDLFSAERLKDYARSGVTDIYLEQLESTQHLADQVASGSISAQEFVKGYEQFGHAKFLSAEDNITEKIYLAKMIKMAQDLEPPITIHFTQMAETKEQQQQLSDLKAQELQTYFTYNNIIIPFIATYENEANTKLFDVFNNEIKESFTNGAAAPADYLALHDHFVDIIPLEEMDKLATTLISLKQEQRNLHNQYETLLGQFRVDNDVLLVDKIMQTRAPDGKIIIEHGAAHGGKRDNDLDELLLQRGLSSTRVNAVYDINDLKRMQESNTYTDVSEISYFPKTNELQISDTNNDGKINGSEGVEPLTPLVPITNNDTYLIIKH